MKKISYGFMVKFLIALLSIIFIAEGLNLVFNFGFNHHLYHIFWIIVAFCTGVFVCEKFVESQT